MSDLITDEHFTDGQSRINASNMNGIVSRAKVQPDIIASRAESATLNVADYILVLKTDNTLAKAKFSTIVNSTGSALPLADSTKNGMLRQTSGKTTDFVDGTNTCRPISAFLPPGVVVSYAGPNIPTGWLFCDGTAISRTTYAGLFAAIGGYYGSGDGSTTFNLPNCAGKFVGYIGALGTSGGATTAVLTTGNLPAHSHGVSDAGHAHATVAHSHVDNGHVHNVPNPYGTVLGVQNGGATSYIANGNVASVVGFANLLSAAPNTDLRGTGIGIQNTGNGFGFSIMNPYLSMYYMIKT